MTPFRGFLTAPVWEHVRNSRAVVRTLLTMILDVHWSRCGVGEILGWFVSRWSIETTF